MSTFWRLDDWSHVRCMCVCFRDSSIPVWNIKTSSCRRSMSQKSMHKWCYLLPLKGIDICTQTGPTGMPPNENIFAFLLAVVHRDTLKKMSPTACASQRGLTFIDTLPQKSLESSQILILAFYNIYVFFFFLLFHPAVLWSLGSTF